MVRVAIIHPDLGVGGAERLIVDAAKALQDKGHHVTIYTGYHNPDRCFEETRDGTIRTIPVGQWIPRTIFGRCHALLAYLKMVYIAFYLMLQSSHDLILIDQVSAPIPFLKLNLRNRPKVVFYCHFPDQLLTKRESFAKALYRKPLDKFEEWSTSLADQILVNSQFTSSIVKRTFPSLQKRDLTILYPCVDVNYFINNKPTSNQDCDDLFEQYHKLSRNKFIYLSLNRFERKKSISLAIEALADCLFQLKNRKLKLNQENRKVGLHLIVAGGYDPRLQDSVAYREELIELARDLELEPHITFIESPSDKEKLRLLYICDAVVYTPKFEHFGIVPLEAMVMSKPVIASASGGPLETIDDGFNGYLCHGDDSQQLTEAMLKLYTDQDRSLKMGAHGFKCVQQNFSYVAFRNKLNRICFPS